MSETKPSLLATSAPPSKRDGPDYRDTTQLEAVKVPPNALEALLYEVKALRADVAAVREDAIVENKWRGLVDQRFDAVARRFESFEGRLEGVEQRQNSGSERAKSFSDEQASILARLDAVEANQVTAAEERATTAAYVKEIRDTVVTAASKTSRFVSHPKVVFVGKVIFALAAAYSAAHGLKVLP